MKWVVIFDHRFRIHVAHHLVSYGCERGHCPWFALAYMAVNCTSVLRDLLLSFLRFFLREEIQRYGFLSGPHAVRF